MCTTCVSDALRGHGDPGTRVTDVCNLICGYWVLNPGLLQEQVLLTTEQLSSLASLILNRTTASHSQSS